MLDTFRSQHSSKDIRATLSREYTEDLPSISKYEIKITLERMKHNKPIGLDGVIIEMIKRGSTKVLHLIETFDSGKNLKQ